MRKSVNRYVGIHRPVLSEIITLKLCGMANHGIARRLRGRADPRVSVVDTIKYLEKKFDVPWSRARHTCYLFTSTPQDVYHETELHR